MSELRSTIEALRSEQLAELPDARLEDDFVELRQAMEHLELESLRRLGELDRRRVFARDGHLSTASWLVARLRTGWGAAKRDVRMARALERMPITRRTIEAGDLSLTAARVLVDAQRSEPQAFAGAETTLVEAATRHAPRELNRVIWHWRANVMREAGADPDEILLERRHLHASTTFMGMVRVDGLLDPECGESLLTAIGAVMDADARRGAPDERSPAQRRADALAEVCRGWLDGAQRPTVAGERPHVNVVVDLATIRGETSAPTRVELDNVGQVSGDAARRIACDASVTRVIVDGTSEPLDIGRRTSVVPPALRRALVLRDGGCRFPNCDRPHAWCDAHHILHWADGGATALDNLVLLCRRHHRLMHGSHAFRVAVVDGAPRFVRPDGTTIDDRGPP